MGCVSFEYCTVVVTMAEGFWFVAAHSTAASCWILGYHVGPCRLDSHGFVCDSLCGSEVQVIEWLGSDVPAVGEGLCTAVGVK